MNSKKVASFVFRQGVIQAVFEIGNRFWAHRNLHPNFDKLPKNKNIKLHCGAYSASRPPPALYNIQTLNL